MIKDIYAPVYRSMAPIFTVVPVTGPNRAENIGTKQYIDLFNTVHNKKISWDHLLRQTSDWEGTLWGKPDWADRPSNDPKSWLDRPRQEPGTEYEYNDTRVNVLALALTNIWRQPLQNVLKKYIMDPIGCSNTWRWMGYDNSWIVMDGQAIQVPSGGGHWGGGMFINAFDQARFGYLTLHKGKWKDHQILSDEWIQMSTTPTPAKPDYGFMNWFLNTNKQRMPDAPENSFCHIGAGVNLIYVDPEHNIVVVARWIDGQAINEFIKKVLNSITP